ncbi:MAG: HAMP domain-containing protein [Gemmatimonadetes bacterium]|nr:HAMP domain-containing protein [Gemmatimonadota bacterium]NNK63343.1 HAMP domain-containing protein [Gemmatimonadota bacterium]
MDLRTKLVFALVLTALGSMLALGTVAYNRARVLVTQVDLDQIDALAQTRAEAVAQLVATWDERVSLIASRTQLRRSLAAHGRTGDPAAAESIRIILQDALASVNTVRALEVRDRTGVTVARVGDVSTNAADTVRPDRDGGSPVVFEGIAFEDDRAPALFFRTPLVLDDEAWGSLLVTLDGGEVLKLVESVEGMGDTGQTILVARDLDGRPHIVRPGRAGPSGPLDVLAPSGIIDPVRRTLDGEGGGRSEVVDGSGERVWVAGRPLPEVGWGLVVAFDEAEELAPLQVYRTELRDLALSLSAIAILAGTLLGLRFAKPLHDLAEVANRIRAGELNARAPEDREDEIGLLARTFNQMTDELETQLVLLKEYEKFFDVSLDLMCIAGTDGYFKRVNPAFTRTLGWNADQLLQKPFFDLIHPDDIAATEEVVGTLSEGVPTVSFRNRFRCVDGSYRTLVWASYPDPDTGLLYALARDVTDQASG